MQPYLLQFLLMTFAGWLNRKQQDAIEYLKEENRVLREQLGGRRIRFSNDQRRRLAAKGESVGKGGLESSRWPRDPRHLAVLVQKSHRAKVRWEPAPQRRSSTHAGNDS